MGSHLVGITFSQLMLLEDCFAIYLQCFNALILVNYSVYFSVLVIVFINVVQ